MFVFLLSQFSIFVFRVYFASVAVTVRDRPLTEALASLPANTAQHCTLLHNPSCQYYTIILHNTPLLPILHNTAHYSLLPILHTTLLYWLLVTKQNLLTEEDLAKKENRNHDDIFQKYTSSTLCYCYQRRE